MADAELVHPLGIIDKRNTQGTASRVTSPTLAIYNDINQMRTYLAASTGHGAGYYSVSRLNQMTRNDMVMAVRQLADAAGI